MARKSKKSGSWLKRMVVALIAAVAALLFTKRTVLAPSQPKNEYKLPPVPDVPQPGPEEATPLTEEEQRQLARERSEAAGESGDVTGAIEEAAEAGANGATAETGSVPPPISYEIAAKAAEEAKAARETGTDEGRKLADQIEQRMYFAPSGTETEAQGIAHEPAARAAEEADTARETGTEAGGERAEAIDQRMYAGAAPAGQPPVEPVSEVESITIEQEERADAAEEAAGEGVDTAGGSSAGGAQAHLQGDTAPDVTSEGYDVSDAADHTGMKPADREEPTDVGLDIDVLLEDDEEASPDITSEGMDTGAAGVSAGEAPSGVLTSGEGYVRLSGDQRECPEEYPIKGNASSRIYHKPGESSYDATIPEICFASDEVADSMGFRPRKR
jgi:hypothetical protein